jgi:hypothetical protein
VDTQQLLVASEGCQYTSEDKSGSFRRQGPSDYFLFSTNNLDSWDPSSLKAFLARNTVLYLSQIPGDLRMFSLDECPFCRDRKLDELLNKDPLQSQDEDSIIEALGSPGLQKKIRKLIESHT